jgi:hypothetical protein
MLHSFSTPHASDTRRGKKATGAAGVNPGTFWEKKTYNSLSENFIDC